MRKPDLPDILIAYEYVPDVPDWMWQDLVMLAVGSGVVLWWKNKDAIARWTNHDQVIQMGRGELTATPHKSKVNITDTITLNFIKGVPSEELVGTLKGAARGVASSRGSASGVLTVGSERTATWNVYAPNQILRRTKRYLRKR